ncbi:MAG: transposase [[Clostridium] leptum]
MWVSDITAFKFGDKYYYLCAIIDLFSRKIISYRISQNSSTQLLTKTFKQAYSERKPERRLMFHSDRGTQYMSYTFVHLLEDFGVKQSFSRTARPHDNAVRRSVFLNPQKRRTISAALYFRSGSDKRYSSVY